MEFNLNSDNIRIDEKTQTQCCFMHKDALFDASQLAIHYYKFKHLLRDGQANSMGLTEWGNLARPCPIWFGNKVCPPPPPPAPEYHYIY